jgi:tripartite-type tricarboxylate transporter receptor subunit TctC
MHTGDTTEAYVNVVRQATKPLAAVALLGLVTAGCSDGGAEASGGSSSEGCFAGERLDFGVPYEAGGGYDQYARLVAPFLEDELDATIVVRNEPGAGGLLSLNTNASGSGDEPRLQILEGFSSVGAQIGGGEGVQYDLTEWPLVGRLIAEPEVVFTGADSGLESWDDVLAATEPLKFGSAGPGGSDYIQGTILQQAFGVPIELTPGFQGTTDIVAALLRGDVELTESSMGTALPLIEDGSVRPLLVVAAEPAEELPDVPLPSDYADDLDEDGAAALSGITSMIEVGRAVATTPGIDESCLTELQDGFTAVMENEEFVSKAEEAGRPVDPLSGSELTEVVESVFRDAEGTVLEEILTEIYSR